MCCLILKGRQYFRAVHSFIQTEERWFEFFDFISGLTNARPHKGASRYVGTVQRLREPLLADLVHVTREKSLGEEAGGRGTRERGSGSGRCPDRISEIPPDTYTKWTKEKKRAPRQPPASL